MKNVLPKPKKTQKQVLIRMPVDLWKDVAHAAVSNLCSINTVIVDMLRNEVKQHKEI